MARATFWLLVAWASIDASVAVYLAVNGLTLASTLLLAAGVFAIIAVTYRSVRLGPGAPVGTVEGPLLMLVVAHLLLRTVVPFRAEPPPPDVIRATAAVALLALGGSVLASRLRRDPRWIVGALVLAAVAGIAARFQILWWDSDPTFDVPLILEEGGAALLRGADPYLTFVYDSGFPYLPLSAIAAAGGVLLGDARWAVVAGEILTTAGIVLFAIRMGASRRLAWSGAALWAWWSGGLYVAWQGFPEPVLTGFAVMAAAAVAPRARPILGGILVGLAAATKQFGLGLLPFLLVWPTGRRQLVVGAATWLVIVLPFALWHPVNFAEGTFWSQIAEPSRPHSLNLLNLPGALIDVPLLVVFPAAFLVGSLIAWRLGPGVSAWLGGSAGAMLIAFVLNPIAFVNYYTIPLVLILLLILAIERRAKPLDTG